MSKFDGKVLVFGGTGGVGSHVVKYLLQEQIPVRLFLRSATKGSELEKQGVELFIGDLKDSSEGQLVKAMEGVKAVISAIGTRKPFSFTEGLNQVDRDGNLKIIKAAKKAGVDRYILCSTMGVYAKRNVTKPFSILFYPKWEAEKYLVESDLNYTIIRPGGLTDDEQTLGAPRDPVMARGRLDGEGGFNGNLGRVHRADVAKAMVQSLWQPKMHNAIYEILNRSAVKSQNQKAIVGTE
jgi:uncharacterized protein YbjT (DUF2867 family)